MGIISKWKTQRKEQRGYNKIVAEKTKIAARQEYAKEAVKVARIRARAKARQPKVSAMQKIRMMSNKLASGSKARTTRKRKSVPTTKARTTRKRKSVSTTKLRSPASLNQTIFGGY